MGRAVLDLPGLLGNIFTVVGLLPVVIEISACYKRSSMLPGLHARPCAPRLKTARQNLLRILHYESKDTTYKFALLRDLIEISSASPHVRTGPDFVTAPFGLLVEKWVQYYWPIIEQQIPQKHGGEKTKPLAVSPSCFVNVLRR